jgi:hypothetical protein
MRRDQRRVGRVYNEDMRRFNSRGVPREELVLALKNRELVRLARQRDQCLICLAPRVTKAGLCEGCLATLTDEELLYAVPWLEERLP